MVVLDDERVEAAHQLGDRGGPLARQRHPRRVVAARLQHERRRHGRRVVERRPQLVEPRAVGVEVDADHVAVERSSRSISGGKRRVLDDDPVTEAQRHLGDAVEGVERAVDHGDRLRPGTATTRRSSSSSDGSTGWSR